MDSKCNESYEEDIRDQPVDYSKKYTEKNVLIQNGIVNDGSVTESSNKGYAERESKVDLYGDYAETDLDQPTDYSLRYAEDDDTDEEDKENSEYFHGCIQEDTVKTYCTEGTPYETPFNFSTATSMSDLRIEDSKETVSIKKIPKKTNEVAHKSITLKQKIPNLCQKSDDINNKRKLNQKNLTVLANSSGLTTPDKPINYYEEGTPGGFSRANSYNSLSSAIVPPISDSDIISNIHCTNSDMKKTSGKVMEMMDEGKENVEPTNVLRNSNIIEPKSSPRSAEKEGKMVTFETPLMFSRSSSLGSLSGFEQHSIHDDRSSIISDFSRRTSGVISPSELPDSPTQTVPPSPHSQKVSDYANKSQDEGMRFPPRHLSFSRATPKRSVFEDDIATFKEESTPVDFSTATSLSSLTIDDEPKVYDESILQNRLRIISNPIKEVEKNMSNMKIDDSEKSPEKDGLISDMDEEDESILEDCINMGMKQFSRASNVDRANVRSFQTSISALKHPKRPADIAVPDTVRIYCTEDTPADISPVGSHSNLSVLSMPSLREDKENVEQKKSDTTEYSVLDLSDESSNLSVDDEKLLNECIQSGMPKIHKLSESSMLYARKKEMMQQKTDVYGTTSSSSMDHSQSNKNLATNKSTESSSIMHDLEISDENSEDEAALTEFIKSAMPKRTNITLPQNQAAINRTAPRRLTNHPSPSPKNQYTERKLVAPKKQQAPLDDSFNFSEDDEDILAQCIRSAMPKKAIQTSPVTPAPVSRKMESRLRSLNIPHASTSSHNHNASHDTSSYIQAYSKSHSYTHSHIQSHYQSPSPSHSNIRSHSQSQSRNQNRSPSHYQNQSPSHYQNQIPSFYRNQSQRYLQNQSQSQSQSHYQNQNQSQSHSYSHVHSHSHSHSHIHSHSHSQGLSHSQVHSQTNRNHTRQSTSSRLQPSASSISEAVHSLSNTDPRYSDRGLAKRSDNRSRQVHNQNYHLNPEMRNPRVAYPRKLSRFETENANVRRNPIPSNSRPTISNYRPNPVSRFETTSANVSYNAIPNGRASISNCRSPTVVEIENEDDNTCHTISKPVISPSRRSSGSSLSEEGSLGSAEEWALEMCISSGMPGGKYRTKPVRTNKGQPSNIEDCEPTVDDNCSECSYNSYVCKR